MIARPARAEPFDEAAGDRFCAFFDERLFDMADELQKCGWRRGADLDRTSARQLAADLLSWMRRCVDDELTDQRVACERAPRGRP